MRCFFKPQRHRGTKVLIRLLSVSLCLCGSSLFLSGCSLFGVGEAEYACPEPGKGVCKSARQIYKDTDSTPTEKNSRPFHLKSDLNLTFVL